MKKVTRAVLVAVSGLGLLVPMLTWASGQASASVFSSLTLENGWTGAPFGTRQPGISLVNGIVTFKGAISGGTTGVAFNLPVADRPATDVYLPVDTCNATNGRLHITPVGVAEVEVPSGGSFSNAQCFTSLDGVSFAPTTQNYTALTLQNGWTNAPFSTSNAEVKIIGGLAHLKGAIAGGSTNVTFTLPTGFRPATDVYIPIDLCDAANGRLHITPAGVANVEAEGSFSDAQCFTSLDGATYALSATGFTPLTLQNGWTNAPFATSNAAAEDIDGIVHLKGAIATTGTNAQPFTLPAAFRPTSTAYVKVDLCAATNGRLEIESNGVVTVQAEGGTFSNAQCFTSLDGVTFDDLSFTTFGLQNGWTSGPFGTAATADAISTGIVTLKGAIATTGTNAQAFTLATNLRPSTNVYVPVDLCGATNGRLLIQSSGAVSVQAEGNTFSNAQCFTSLEGVTYGQSSSGFTALTLQNGWTNAPFGTSNAEVKNVGGIVYFKGAIATAGTDLVPFTLPAGFRPSTDVYVKVDLCDATNGRLHIRPSGVVDVEAEGGTTSHAQCFTSLDGASFATSASGFLNLTLQNGWTNAPFSTSAGATQDILGIVHFKGAITSGGTNLSPFTLPAALRPALNVYVPVDLCNATNGRLFIQHSGSVTIQPEGGVTANATCFTSLDGVSFTP